MYSFPIKRHVSNPIKRPISYAEAKFVFAVLI